MLLRMTLVWVASTLAICNLNYHMYIYQPIVGICAHIQRSIFVTHELYHAPISSSFLCVAVRGELRARLSCILLYNFRRHHDREASLQQGPAGNDADEGQTHRDRAIRH